VMVTWVNGSGNLKVLLGEAMSLIYPKHVVQVQIGVSKKQGYPKMDSL